MKLISFSVKNFRSITVARKIPTEEFTVLVGKNNEGKSNILRALTLAMEILVAYAENPNIVNKSLPIRIPKIPYEFEKDFPVQLQGKDRENKSVFDLEFQLTENEVKALKDITEIRLSSPIVPIRVGVGQYIDIDIPKKGSPAFKENAREIIDFVCKKIRFNLIPAVRTERDALLVIDRIIAAEFRSLERNESYRKALQVIDSIQRRTLEEIASEIKVPLNLFLPTVKKISINTINTRRRPTLNSDYEVVIDDGVPTNIQNKGDGVKSLTALAMLNMYNNENEMASVIAIEEPESHLHPEAMHQLYQTIINMTEKNQIILTTHSPLFVNRDKVKSNILVGEGEAKPARHIKDVRETLGVLVSDNLVNANHILFVEGDDDRISLHKILSGLSEKIKKALRNNTLIICSIAGASNLSYNLALYKNMQCKYHVLLDNDQAGNEAFEKAEKRNLITAKDATFTICNGCSCSEFEDCLDKKFYENVILEEFGVDINTTSFRGSKKWSDRMRSCFLSQGKRWNDDIEQKVKLRIAENVPDDPSIALNEKRKSFIDALVSAIEDLAC